MKARFQAHRVLESNFDFRLISGLENAGGERPVVFASFAVTGGKTVL
jgi:hypothetical protein